MYQMDTLSTTIWTESFVEAGEFEFFTQMMPNTFEMFPIGGYIQSGFSENLMIIENYDLTFDSDSGVKLKVSGRDLKSILTRRIIWQQTTLTGSLQDAIERLLNENLIAPKDASRKIPGVIFKKSTDKAILDLKVDVQFTGDNLYSSIIALCTINKIGLMSYLDANNNIVFELRASVNRSYSQDINPVIEFSKNFDNLISTTYRQVHSIVKNVGLVAGEGEGLERKTVTVGTTSGLERREMFIDARDITSEVDDVVLPIAEYNKLLTARGETHMKDYKEEKDFQGDIETLHTFEFNKDYFIGDIVQVAFDYGLESESRVETMVFTSDANGESIYPTFKMIENEGS